MKIAKFIKRIFKKRHSSKPTTPRVEKDTMCDTCERLEQCKKENNVMDCTSLYDSRTHYCRSFGGFCFRFMERGTK